MTCPDRVREIYANEIMRKRLHDYLFKPSVFNQFLKPDREIPPYIRFFLRFRPERRSLDLREDGKESGVIFKTLRGRSWILSEFGDRPGSKTGMVRMTYLGEGVVLRDPPAETL